MQAGDFYRTKDGPNAWRFGRCRRHDDEWLVVESYGRGEPRFGWAPINSRTAYPYGLSDRNIAEFLKNTEIWP